jgi:phosphogluconate dehydratase
VYQPGARFCGFPANDKLVLKEVKKPSVAIVSSYNDMLSAHQPFEAIRN